MTQKAPKIDPSCFVAEGARIIGDVTLEKGVGIWFNAVLRGDQEAIVVMENANVQDNCVIHTSTRYPTRIGKNASLGHCAVVHGATIGDNALVGMNAVVLNGAVIGEGSVVAAGAVVKEGMIVPPASLVAGVPARLLKENVPALAEATKKNGEEYQRLRDEHLKKGFDVYRPGPS
ncbi:MAG: gamma carbonic anhydrase family protein [Thermoplasmata archaeon]|nr:gamma carbonic anhydrase family protein [Thermoplasmata archaeon]